MSEIKEVVVVSGKGGTGKTSLTGALSFLFPDKVVADCDVDAANLHLILNPEKFIRTTEFIGGKKAAINRDLCTGCGICRDVCVYEAISADFVIDSISCEGCGACQLFCPSGAVDFSARVSGRFHVSHTDQNEPFIFAEMFPGEENSGKLVAAVRNEAREEALKRNAPVILIDGPPGIGCPVISSLTGTHLAVVVTEPTPTGLHDLRRIVELARHFQIRTAVVVNKGDINAGYTEEIREYCETNNLVFLGTIPYEPAITSAQKEAKTILEFAPTCSASGAIREIYIHLHTILEES